MKKSELYRLAQIAVLKDWDIAPQDKLELVDLLTGNRELELFKEKQDEEKGAEQGGEL